MRGLRYLASWILALVLIFLYLQVTIHPLPDPPEGFVQLFDRPGENVAFQTMAEKTGIALLEPTGRVVVALIELVLCLFLLVPASRRPAAVVSMVLLTCALIAHLLPDVLGRELPASLAPDERSTDYGRHFALGVSMLALSILLFYMHPRSRRRRDGRRI
ncbi:hypothetical protein [Henriciella litoralis]|uniref:hypothetical protein n=1 Tax=Henriciella litoralis TaxID=568102 RepID=UPI0009FC69C6|nr:hypothetical protein [Henriciella litoralis]